MFAVMTQVLYTQNVHMNRAIADAEWEAHVTRVIRADYIHDQTCWALVCFAVWVFGMAVDWFKTFYAAQVEGAGAMAGLSSFIGLGVIITAMCFAVWKQKR